MKEMLKMEYGTYEVPEEVFKLMWLEEELEQERGCPWIQLDLCLSSSSFPTS